VKCSNNRAENFWGDVVGRTDAGSPGSDGASPYPELRPTCAGRAMSKRQLVEWPSGVRLYLILALMG
jgi:hypothetical protein